MGDMWDTERERYIQYGAQFADYVKMAVIGVLTEEKVTVEPQPCISASRAPARTSMSLR